MVRIKNKPLGENISVFFVKLLFSLWIQANRTYITFVALKITLIYSTGRVYISFIGMHRYLC